MGEDFYDEYESGKFNAVVFDEFYGQKRLTWMNTFLQGDVMTLRSKGGQIIKRDNPACIILSNHPISEVYLGVPRVQREAFASRLLEIEVTEPLVELCQTLDDLFRNLEKTGYSGAQQTPQGTGTPPPLEELESLTDSPSPMSFPDTPPPDIDLTYPGPPFELIDSPPASPLHQPVITPPDRDWE